MLHLLYNSEVAGAAIRASIQQLTDSGLGLLWSDTLTQWTTSATAFNDRTNPVTGQVVSDNAVAYYGTSTFNNTYTGRIIVGYHDTNNSNNIIFSEVRYVRRGVELSFTLAPDRLQTQIGEPFIAHLSRRGDNKIVALNEINVGDDDTQAMAFDLAHLVPKGVTVSDVTSVAVSPSGQMTVTALGGKDAFAVLDIASGQVAGTTYDVSCTALLSSGDQVECNVKVNCKVPFA